jgi:nucleotide-binding universal stress UspA family protein
MIRAHDRLLVPTDFSAGAELALARALHLPLRSGAKIVILHVLTDASPQTEASARGKLAELAARTTPPPGTELVTELATGEPFAQIIARSRALDAGLVVIGRHGRRRVRDLFIGSTAERTIRYGDVPVLVVNTEATGPYRRPLLATNLDECAKRLADLALGVLEPDVPITILHAYRVAFESLQHAPVHGTLDHELETNARAGLAKLLGTLEVDRARWQTVVRRGDARTVILTEIVGQDADLVALGTHGRSGLAHMLVGSVAEWVIASAVCDVLVTRPARFTFQMP